ncbi:MAG TPA: peptide deformylase [Candidatus Saccharimonadales bacterium]|nr:peptide deformylase [Candidatus Saccharimonadales bacterium]HVX58037.1 peptide deformylase [Candidatus Saccharimonadales bacterium]
MTKEDIITLPNPHLRQKSQRVGIITPEIRQIVDDMKGATMDWDHSRDHEVGVALAAVQIDRLYRIVIVRDDYNDKENQNFTVFINPQITKREGEIAADFEGCLSVPNVYGKVPRHSKVRVKALNLDGREFRVTAEGFLARIFQHEIDHTHGIVFIDHIKDDPSAFYRLREDDGKLEALDYDKDIKDNADLWGSA